MNESHSVKSKQIGMNHFLTLKNQHVKRTAICLRESWRCHAILTKAKVAKSLLSLRDDL